MKTSLPIIVLVILCVALVGWSVARAATQYGAGTLLQNGDVQSRHILDGTIKSADISNDGGVDLDQVVATSTPGQVLFTGGDRIAT